MNNAVFDYTCPKCYFFSHAGRGVTRDWPEYPNPTAERPSGFLLPGARL